MEADGGDGPISDEGAKEGHPFFLVHAEPRDRISARDPFLAAPFAAAGLSPELPGARKPTIRTREIGHSLVDEKGLSHVPTIFPLHKKKIHH
jgi:hypothetical protein